MTIDRIRTLRALLAAGTPRPWGMKESSNAGGRLHRAGISQEDLAMDPQEDLELLVAAVNELPDLLDVVEAVAAIYPPPGKDSRLSLTEHVVAEQRLEDALAKLRGER